jgi:hypothetical protein
MLVSSRNKPLNLIRFILIILFAIIFDSLVVESLGMILEIKYDIPTSQMASFGFWGDTFYSRIFVSLIGTWIGGFILGAHLEKKLKLGLILYSSPIIIFWASLGVLFYYSPLLIIEFSLSHRYFIIPAALVLLTWPVAYHGSILASAFKEEIGITYRANSIFNITWYHWLWIFPLFLMQVVANLGLAIVSIWHELWNEESLLGGLIFNFGNTMLYVVLAAILTSSFTLTYYVYKLLSNNTKEDKFKWLKIVGVVLLFQIIYSIFFKNRLLISPLIE